jgi:hypothetical protein
MFTYDELVVDKAVSCFEFGRTDGREVIFFDKVFIYLGRTAKPESIFLATTAEYVKEYLLTVGNIRNLVELPEPLLKLLTKKTNPAFEKLIIQLRNKKLDFDDIEKVVVRLQQLSTDKGENFLKRNLNCEIKIVTKDENLDQDETLFIVLKPREVKAIFKVSETKGCLTYQNKDRNKK